MFSLFQPLSLVATPERRDVKGALGTASIGVLGVTASTDPKDVRTERRAAREDPPT